MLQTTHALVCLALAFALGGCATSPGQMNSGQAAVVEFSYDELNPETVTIAPDGNIRWVNLAPDARGFVVFPASIAKSFACGDDLSPYFQKIEGGFESLPIESFEPNHVQLPCALAPGTYAYEVAIMGAGFGETDARNPQRKLQGTIVVE